jgi:hypothetical protein
MMTPLDAAYQAKVTSGAVAAIEAAGILVEHSYDGWEASDAAAAQRVLDGYDPLPESKAAKLAALYALYAEKQAEGRSYAVPGDATGAHVYQIDEVPTATRQSSLQAIDQVKEMGSDALSNGLTGTAWDPVNPNVFKFYDASNVGVAMTPQQAADFARNISVYVNGLKQNLLRLAGLIAAAATQSELDAIDITVMAAPGVPGWPSNP